jgi:hypothetical protein
MSLDPTDREGDIFAPPAIPTEVGCLHCGEEYESYLIEWRVKTSSDGKEQGFWCCPTPGCDGRGFGFDLLPLDPEYQDEHGGWIHTDEEDEPFDEDFDLLDEKDDEDGPGEEIPF